MYEANDLWTGIQKQGSEWKYADGTSLSTNFELQWVSGYPKSDASHDVIGIHCSEDSNFGKLFNKPKTDTSEFVCENKFV